METSDFIAALALFASVGSAVYARWAGRAAQRANEIAMHNERLRIYKGLLTFRATLTTRGPGFPDQALWEFADLVLLSEFYYSQSAHEAMQKLLDDGNQIQAQHDLWKHARESGGNGAAAAKAMNELHRATRDQCSVVADMLKPDLLLQNTNPRRLV